MYICLWGYVPVSTRDIIYVDNVPPPAFISNEEGLSITTIIITHQVFTRFSHGNKWQRFSYDTGRCPNCKIKFKKKSLLVKGNPPRSGNNTAPVIATVDCTKYGHSCSLSFDSD